MRGAFDRVDAGSGKRDVPGGTHPASDSDAKAMKRPPVMTSTYHGAKARFNVAIES
jgi:hypothetical protein